MNLLEIRQQFRVISGRYDLVDDAGVDQGADFYINEGCKFLDGLDETQKSWASCFRFLEVGFWGVQFPYCRAVKEVWVADPVNGRWQLEKLNLQDLVSNYMTTLPSLITNGSPLYYSPGITRNIPEDTPMDEFESFIGFVDIPYGDAHEYNTVIISPPTDTKCVVIVNGLFYSAKLINDTDKNYWSEAHPMLLLMGAMRQLEIMNRNTQGVNDWERSIRTDVASLGMDLVEELIAEADQMGG